VGGEWVMKENYSRDKACIEKIIKYIYDLENCFTHFNIKSYEDLQKNRLAQLATTQLITNLSETKKLMQQTTLGNIQPFASIKVTTTRHIASHDYDSVNFKIIYDICQKLLMIEVMEVLKSEHDKL